MAKKRRTKVELNLPAVIVLEDKWELEYINRLLKSMSPYLQCLVEQDSRRSYVVIVYYEDLPTFDDLLGCPEFEDWIEEEFGLTESGFEEAREWYSHCNIGDKIICA